MAVTRRPKVIRPIETNMISNQRPSDSQTAKLVKTNPFSLDATLCKCAFCKNVDNCVHLKLRRTEMRKLQQIEIWFSSKRHQNLKNRLKPAEKQHINHHFL